MAVLDTKCTIAGVTGLHHDRGEIRYDDDMDAEIQHSQCRKCGQPLERWWMEAEDDRAGGWSKWAARQYVIQEITL